MKQKKTMLVLLCCIGALFVALAAIFTALFLLRYTKNKNYNEQISLGDKYLKEMNYEDAELAYIEAIKINEKQPAAYVKLADVYIETENLDAAENIIKKGIRYAEETEELEEKLIAVQALILEAQKPEPTPTPEPAQEMDAEAIYNAYMEYMQSKEYEQYTGDWMKPADSYAVLDIDGDQVDELLINSGTEMGWFNVLLYTYNLETEQIELVRDIYYYGGLRYSAENKALVYNDFKPTVMMGGSNFDVLENGELVPLFGIGWEGENYAIYYQDERTEGITKEQYDAYYEEITDIEFLSLSELGKTKTKEDLVDYLDTDFYEFLGRFDDMRDVGASDGSTEYSNSYLIISCSPWNSYPNGLNFVNIKADCEYSIDGIFFGMEASEAEAMLNGRSISMTDNQAGHKRYVNEEGRIISVWIENGKVSGISAWSE